MRLRGAELRLLLFPAAIAIVGFWALSVSTENHIAISTSVVRTPAIVAGALLAVTLLWSATRFRGDQVLFPAVASIAVLGLVMLHRLQPDLTRRDEGLAQIASRQVIFVLVGIAVAALVARFFRHWSLLRRYRYTLLLVCILLLLVTFVFGEPINGARLWITIGPVQAQPSEVIKIGLVLFLAAFLDDNRDVINAQWRVGPLRLPPLPYLLPMLIMWGTALLVLVVENDLGSALLLYGIFLAMLYAGTGRPLYVLVGLTTFALAAWGAYLAFDRIGLRVQNWLDPWQDPLGGGYQQVQSDYAVAAGGVLGEGLGRGQPWRIPEVQTDFIFSAIAEETGMLGTLALLMLFVVVVVRGFTIALQTPDNYLRLVAIGLSATLGLQTVIILGGVIRLIPLTGITLPFISYGGSSLLTNFLIIGMLLSISAAPTNRAEGIR